MANKLNTTKLSLLLIITLISLLLIPSHSHKQEEEETSAEEELFGCFVKCDKKQANQRDLSACEQKCVDHYKERKREEGEEGGGGDESSYPRIVVESKKNPYFFESQRFDSKYTSEEGCIRVLERFSKRSELLRGIENFRLAILEANPNTFVVPHHCDAESVFVVVGGKGTISYIWQNQRQSFNLKHGDVMRVPAGSIVYLINRDNSEKLRVLKLLQPVNTPGRFKEYFGAGGENPESYYRAFSNEILEAAFNVPRERLEKLFGQQQQGVIIKASKEQIRALSKESKPAKGRKEESWSPFNLLEEHPLTSSQYGQFFVATPNDHDQLKDMDISVAYMNIKKGGMVAPYYNSKSTKMVFVVGGSGNFEMACPHLLNESQQQGSQRTEERHETRTGVHYQKVSASLSVGDVFIIPAGHPVTMIASQDSNLQLVGFGNKAFYSNTYFLAGQENVWNHVQSEAKELAFKMPAREIEEILRSQKESFFLPGPGQRKEAKGHMGPSILDFPGF